MNGTVHTSQELCHLCGAPLRWVKVSYYDDDAFYNWHLDVWCPECGAPPTEASRKACRAEFDAEVGRGIAEMQAAGIRAAVGRKVWRRLDE